MFKKYMLALILGCTAGAITIWALDSFTPQEPKYFAKAFLKALFPVTIALIVVHFRKKGKV